MTPIGFLGTGHIAAPMVRFLAQKGHPITATRRTAEISAELSATHGVEIAENQDVVDASGVVFLCLRPQVAHDALAPLTFRLDQRIVSVMAGISRKDLEDLCAPATVFVQTVPLGFIEQGECPLAAFGETAELEALFAPENPVVAVQSEADLNACFAICALVPGLVDMMVGASSWLAAQIQDAGCAEYYTSQLIAGFLGSLDRESAGHLARARDELATEGTLSLQMVEGLRTQGMTDVVTSNLGAILARLEERR